MAYFKIFSHYIYFLNHQASICCLSDTLSPSHSPRSDTSQKDLHDAHMGPVMFTADELYVVKRSTGNTLMCTLRSSAARDNERSMSRQRAMSRLWLTTLRPTIARGRTTC